MFLINLKIWVAHVGDYNILKSYKSSSIQKSIQHTTKAYYQDI